MNQRRRPQRWLPRWRRASSPEPRVVSAGGPRKQARAGQRIRPAYPGLGIRPTGDMTSQPAIPVSAPPIVQVVQVFACLGFHGVTRPSPTSKAAAAVELMVTSDPHDPEPERGAPTDGRRAETHRTHGTHQPHTHVRFSAPSPNRLPRVHSRSCPLDLGARWKLAQARAASKVVSRVVRSEHAASPRADPQAKAQASLSTPRRVP